jgi:hypothetical protein
VERQVERTPVRHTQVFGAFCFLLSPDIYHDLAGNCIWTLFLEDTCLTVIGKITIRISPVTIGIQIPAEKARFPMDFPNAILIFILCGNSGLRCSVFRI